MLKYHSRRPAIHHEHSEGAKVARLSFMVNVGDAAFWTILPIQLSVLAGGDGPVGFYYALIALIGTAVAVVSSEMFRRYRKIAIGAVSLVAMAVLLAGMSVADDIWILALFDVPRSVFFMLVTIVLGLLVRDFATTADLAMQEGRYYQYSNFGWLIGPVAAGYIAYFYSNEAVFLFVALVFTASLLYLWHLHLRVHPAMAHHGDIQTTRHAWADLREFLSRPRLRRVFVLAFGMEFWWIVSSIYIPLAVIGLGYGPEVVGWVVAGGIIPLVLLEPWVGRKAQERGTRSYITVGFGILAAGSLSFALVGFSPELLLFLFAAINVGAALIEPLTDTYFFESARGDEAEEFFGIYNASAPFANLVGPLLGAAVFTIGFGLEGVWILTAVFLLLCAKVALRIGRADG